MVGGSVAGAAETIVVTIMKVSRRLHVAITGTRVCALRRWTDRFDRAEIAWVERQNRFTRYKPLRVVVLLVNHCGNGWLYPILATWLVLGRRREAATVIAVAALAALVAHGVYPFVKAWVARPRPFTRTPALCVVGSPLDIYSFPSGHSMTAAAVLVVLGRAYPETIPAAIVGVGLLAWVRVACAHHYPTDLVVGAILGAAIALPISRALLG
jgi:undecaprenyl-diphosphatase